MSNKNHDRATMLDISDAQPAGVEGLRSVLTFKLARAQARLSAQASHLLRKHSDLSLVEWRVIQLLLLYGETSMSVLANEFEIDKGQLSRKINSMIDKGLVVSERDPSDQRKQILSLTSKSVAVAKHMKPIMDERQKRLRAAISDAELTSFLDVLAKIENAAIIREET